MDIAKIAAGENLPNEVNVIIEISANSEPVKYEFDKDSSSIIVDRFLNVAMRYPCNYGFIPHTLSDDGDPADVLVVTPTPVLPGALIRVRPVAMLEMEDESGLDAKIVAVPVSSLTKEYDHIQSQADLPESLLQQINHFFEHYKDLEASKWVKISGWKDADAAKQEILASVENYKNK